MNVYSIALIDDDEVFLYLTKRAIIKCDNIQVSYTFNNGKEALRGLLEVLD